MQQKKLILWITAKTLIMITAKTIRHPNTARHGHPLTFKNDWYCYFFDNILSWKKYENGLKKTKALAFFWGEKSQ